MPCGEEESILRRLNRLRVPSVVIDKVRRYFDGEANSAEREEVCRLIRFLVEVLDQDFFSDHPQHGAF